ncbi:DUF1311 domain-containing protein [Paracoccus caeni]|uniref:DUF1311 domain-containing protein n=1 Tax=Paracoccus caeni TaxID=657651 RepID=A0A934SIM9_9RHOB|nr:lysozyme inhibitor LprI family protein [Paracoccus caeni]MBK4215839.1 DUF1311 domain-containing protein [Paracoccus caeni]
MLKSLALTLALLAAPAMAQEDLQIDAAILDTCLEATSAEQGDDAESCIGLAAQKCMESPGGDTTAGMSICTGKELDLWDAKLNESYRALTAKAEATDREMDELGSAAEKQQPLLRDMQRNWIGFRDAACGFERSQWGGGSGGGPAGVGCMLDMTARQYLRLDRYLDEGA